MSRASNLPSTVQFPLILAKDADELPDPGEGAGCLTVGGPVVGRRPVLGEHAADVHADPICSPYTPSPSE